MGCGDGECECFGKWCRVSSISSIRIMLIRFREDTNKVTSVSWSNDGAYLAIGLDTGDIEVWDVEENKKMRTMKGHLARVPVMSWHGHVLTSGCRDGSIYHHDVRVAKHKVMELVGHNAEVCGLAWRSDGQFLASGGNDNVVNCWE